MATVAVRVVRGVEVVRVCKGIDGVEVGGTVFRLMSPLKFWFRLSGPLVQAVTADAALGGQLASCPLPT